MIWISLVVGVVAGILVMPNPYRATPTSATIRCMLVALILLFFIGPEAMRTSDHPPHAEYMLLALLGVMASVIVRSLIVRFMQRRT